MAAATNRSRKNSCPWSAAAIPKFVPSRGSGRSWPPQSSSSRIPLFKSLNELAAFLNRGIAGAPRHDRHRRRRILRRAFDQLVGIDHIDQHVALGVAAPNDLHFLEEERTALPEHIVALLHLALEMDRADLAACQRNIRDLLGNPEQALDAALLGH